MTEGLSIKKYKCASTIVVPDTRLKLHNLDILNYSIHLPSPPATAPLHEQQKTGIISPLDVLNLHNRPGIAILQHRQSKVHLKVDLTTKPNLLVVFKLLHSRIQVGLSQDLRRKGKQVGGLRQKVD